MELAVRQSTEVMRREDLAARQFVSIYIDGQLFGVPVLEVRDVIKPEAIYNIPLAPQEVAGSLNLRGRIVTAIDVRTRLGLIKQNNQSGYGMCVVVDYKGELYSLIVDSVGEVLSLYDDEFETNPGTLDPRWKDVSKGVYRLDKSLLIVLDIAGLLSFCDKSEE